MSQPLSSNNSRATSRNGTQPQHSRNKSTKGKEPNSQHSREPSLHYRYGSSGSTVPIKSARGDQLTTDRRIHKGPISRRMSFQDPKGKADLQAYTLLNFMLMKEKKHTPSARGEPKKEEFESLGLDLKKLERKMDKSVPMSTRKHHQPQDIQVKIQEVVSKTSRNAPRTTKKARHKLEPEGSNQPSSQMRQHESRETVKPMNDAAALLKDFEILEVVGNGGFSLVMKVRHIQSGALFALKQMSKPLIIAKNSVGSVFNEKTLLSQVNHTFLINMCEATQDEQHLYLFMEYLPCGDLRYHLGCYNCFAQPVVKHFVSCILIGLEYLHAEGIIHRDLKPQNLVLDDQGYLRITDLGIAKKYKRDTSGTPGYMAPEVITQKEPSQYAVDYFAIGVITYECMLGRRPFKGYSRQQIRQQIQEKEAKIISDEIPEGWSLHVVSFINSLLKNNPNQRLGCLPDLYGCHGVQQIMHHPWLQGVPWDKLKQKLVQSPYLPDPREKNYDTVEESDLDQDTQRKVNEAKKFLYKSPKEAQKMFAGYDWSPE